MTVPARKSAFAASAAILALALLALPAAPAIPQEDGPVTPYRAGDRSITALNILPPGQGRYMNSAELLIAQGGGPQPSQNTDQMDMYDSMVQAAPDVRAAKLGDFFKDASFGVKPDDVVREYSPREGVVILRDRFGVPHVYGETRSDVMYGAGYVSAEDRLFMMDVLRHAGRGRVSEFLGASDANLALDRNQRLFADYTEEELFAIGQRLIDLHPTFGRQFVEDGLNYTDGINAYIAEARTDPSKLPGDYVALQQLPQDWRSTDSIAIATLIGEQLGAGGGDELGNAAFLHALQDEGYTAQEARAVFDDFRFANDPEAPVTTDRQFPYLTDLGPPDPDAVAMPDDPEAVASQMAAAPMVADGPSGPIPIRLPDAASNALLVSSDLSKSGRPLAVYGPQTGYWSPEILMEIDMHGPGIHARGAAFPGISLYVLLGRGAGYAWSATSAGGDQMDIRAAELCDPDGGEPDEDSTFYLRGDECVEMHTRTDTFLAKPSAGGVPEEPSPDRVVVSFTTERTHQGIVQARGTVDGKPVAFVRQRSSYFAEVDSAMAYVQILNPELVDGPEDFQEAFGRFSYTFNWFYVDDQSIAYQLGGYHPLRADGVDPDLPSWGRPRWNWQGMLPFEETPQDVDPAKGFMTSWNNKQAPGFRSSDGQWGYGPTYRNEPLDDRIRAAQGDDGKVDLTELVNAMGDAATVDLRGAEVAPFMLQALGTPEDADLARAAELLEAWAASGAHRRDRDADGAYEHSAAIALMDEWWSRALEAVFRPALGEAFDDVPIGQDNQPGPVGSAYQSGWYGHLQKDLRTILGLPVDGRFSRAYCGGGALAECRSDLLASLSDAVSALEEEFGQDPSTWDADEDADRIEFAPLGVQGQRPMQWQNRPTFQQVLEFGSQ